MNELAIHVDGLGKQYRIGAMPTGYRTLRDALVSGVKRVDGICALKAKTKRLKLYGKRHISSIILCPMCYVDLKKIHIGSFGFSLFNNIQTLISDTDLTIFPGR